MPHCLQQRIMFEFPKSATAIATASLPLPVVWNRIMGIPACLPRGEPLSLLIVITVTIIIFFKNVIHLLLPDRDRFKNIESIFLFINPKPNNNNNNNVSKPR